MFRLNGAIEEAEENNTRTGTATRTRVHNVYEQSPLLAIPRHERYRSHGLRQYISIA